MTKPAGCPKVAVIILNFAVADECLSCVASVLASKYESLKVVVIDNGSPDDSMTRLKADLPKSVTLLVNDNTGYAGGNNLGIKWAFGHGADYILILNPDTTITPDAIGKMVAFSEGQDNWPEFLQGKKLGFIGPRIFHPDDLTNPTIYSDGGVIGPTLTRATLRHNGLKAQGLELAKEPFGCDYITGTALFASREVVEAVGLINEDYFLYYEDADWSLRCRKKGYELVILPDAVVYHEGYKSTGHLSPSYIYYHSRNGLYLAMWNGHWGLKFLAYLISAVKLAKQPIKYFLMPSKRSWLKPISLGIWHAWLGIKGPAPKL